MRDSRAHREVGGMRGECAVPCAFKPLRYQRIPAAIGRGTVDQVQLAVPVDVHHLELGKLVAALDPVVQDLGEQGRARCRVGLPLVDVHVHRTPASRVLRRTALGCEHKQVREPITVDVRQTKHRLRPSKGLHLPELSKPARRTPAPAPGRIRRAASQKQAEPPRQGCPSHRVVAHQIQQAVPVQIRHLQIPGVLAPQRLGLCEHAGRNRLRLEDTRRAQVHPQPRSIPGNDVLRTVVVEVTDRHQTAAQIQRQTRRRRHILHRKLPGSTPQAHRRFLPVYHAHQAIHPRPGSCIHERHKRVLGQS